jgi:hypothetical protein
MKYLFTGLYLVFLINASAQTEGEEKLSVAELLADYDSLHAVIKTVHPKLYANADSIITEKAWKTGRYRINHPMSKWEFHKAVAPLVHQYNDGHTYVDIDFGSKELEAFKTRGGRLFPVPVMISGDKLITINDTVDGITPGSTITAINGVPVEKIVTETQAMMSGDYAENLQANCARLFSYLLWFYYKWDGAFEVSYADGKSIRKKKSVDGIPVDDYFKKLFPSPLWTMKIHPGERLAVIECTGYSGNTDRIKQKLDSFFTIIKEQAIQHVALDLRRNGGGNSYIGNIFLSYITKKPFAAIQTKSYRNSQYLQNFPDSDWRKKDLDAFRASATEKNGFLSASYTADNPPSLSKPELFFNGRFYLLTSYRTYSSAHMTALQVKCSGIGKIIGQPTGEQVDLTGEIKDFILPNTKLSVWVPMAMYTPACKMERKLGVQPDFFVRPTMNDIKNSRDAEVEFLKKRIQLSTVSKPVITK